MSASIDVVASGGRARSSWLPRIDWLPITSTSVCPAILDAAGSTCSSCSRVMLHAQRASARGMRPAQPLVPARQGRPRRGCSAAAPPPRAFVMSRRRIPCPLPRQEPCATPPAIPPSSRADEHGGDAGGYSLRGRARRQDQRPAAPRPPGAATVTVPGHGSVRPAPAPRRRRGVPAGASQRTRRAVPLARTGQRRAGASSSAAVRPGRWSADPRMSSHTKDGKQPQKTQRLRVFKVLDCSRERVLHVRVTASQAHLDVHPGKTVGRQRLPGGAGLSVTPGRPGS